MNGLSCGSWFSSSARSQMLTAMSPMRSRSVVILRPVVMRRRSLRRGLVQGEQAQADVVDLDVHAIDGVVALDGGPAHLVVAVDEARDGVLDLLLDQPAHLEDLEVQLLELGFVVAVGVLAYVHRRSPQPKRPVM